MLLWKPEAVALIIVESPQNRRLTFFVPAKRPEEALASTKKMLPMGRGLETDSRIKLLIIIKQKKRDNS